MNEKHVDKTHSCVLQNSTITNSVNRASDVANKEGRSIGAMLDIVDSISTHMKPGPKSFNDLVCSVLRNIFMQTE